LLGLPCVLLITSNRQIMTCSNAWNGDGLTALFLEKV